MNISVSGSAPIGATINNSSDSPSLFQLADRLHERLLSVPGLSPFLAMCAQQPDFAHNPVPSSVVPPGKRIDPVSHLWQFFRLGSSLCALFNALSPKTPLTVVVTNDVKTCKRSVYDFVQACKSELNYPDDELFTISNVFSDNTTDLLKVIHTVKLLLDTLEERHLISPIEEKVIEPAVATDKRAKTVEELLLTERKYVQDLELLLDYQTQLQESGLLSQDTIHYLFPNLNILIDFQRRFLIGIEYHAQLPPEEQRIGSVFLNFQDGFEVYEGFALNQKKACEIVSQESAKLMALKDVLEPKYALPAFLIKPIQRICKYPLLLRQLVKLTSPDASNYQDQKDALEAIMKVTSKVNEQQRRVENISIVRELSERLTDWKGHDVDDFGSLLHDGIFPVIKNGAERDYHLYLFENIILCCKEVAPSKKPMSLSSKKAKPKRPNPLILKGRIYIAYITNVSKYDTAGYYLHIAWGRDDASDTGFFDIRFRNTEQLDQWCSTITQMTEHYNIDPSSEPYQSSNIGMSHSKEQLSGFNGTSLDEPSDDEYSSPTSVVPMINSAAAQYQQQHYQHHQNHFSSSEDDYTLSSDLQSRLNVRQDSVTSLSTLPSSSQYQNSRTRAASYPVLQNHVHLSKPQYHSMNQSHNLQYQQINSHTSISSSSTSATNSTSDLSDTVVTSGSPHRLLGQEPSRNNLNGESALTATLGALNGTNEKLTSISSSTSSIVASEASSASSSSDSGTIISGLPGNGTLASALTCALSNVINKKPEPKIKVKLHFLDDTFALIVPFAITYTELLERVERKIRLCGTQTPSPLRIKYKDEDDDFVTMRSDDDIMMAIEPKLLELGPEYILQVQNTMKQNGGKLVPPLLGNKMDLLTIWAA